ncbi:MAG: hypothetical protein ACRCSF_06090 [Mycobacteriaceae bacterium]
MNTPIPLPGQHRPELRPGVDPDHLRTKVDELLTKLGHSEPLLDEPSVHYGHSAVKSDSAGHLIVRQAQILEHAHDLLVAALESVDKG